MKKRTLFTVSGLFLLLSATILFLQFIRLDLFHQWFPAKSASSSDTETMSAAKEPLPGQEMNIYIHRNDSELSQGTIDNIEKAMDYAKVRYTEISASEIRNISPSPYNVLVLAGEHSKNWPLERIKVFVESGGRLYIGARFINEEWNELLGITDVSDFKDGIYGLTFEKELFPGYMDLDQTSKLFSHSIADVELSKESEVFITAQNEPILWSNRYGEGKVMVWNTSSVTEKNSRGLMLQALSFLPPAFASNQAGIKVMHIDDFPSPVPAETSKVIQNHYDISTQDFYTDIWWEDMKELSHKYDLSYTGYLIGTYEDEMRMTAEELISERRYPMLYFGRNLLKEKGELGLHGYNHQSLVTNEETIDPSLQYKPWDSQIQMEDSLKRAVKLFNYYFPAEQVESYVPPSNILNETGLAALQNALPHLKTLAALYTGTASEGSFIQEFEQDDKYPDLYHFPRISSGYMETAEDQFIQVDAIANFGMVSHFIHPDDVLDSQRSGDKGWPGLKDNFASMARSIHQTYPYLDNMVQSQATNRMKQYQASDIQVTYEPGQINIKGNEMLSPSLLFLRVNEGQFIETGTYSFGVVERFSETEPLYKVTLTKPSAKISIKDDSL